MENITLFQQMLKKALVIYKQNFFMLSIWSVILELHYLFQIIFFPADAAPSLRRIVTLCLSSLLWLVSGIITCMITKYTAPYPSLKCPFKLSDIHILFLQKSNSMTKLLYVGLIGAYTCILNFNMLLCFFFNFPRAIAKEEEGKGIKLFSGEGFFIQLMMIFCCLIFGILLDYLIRHFALSALIPYLKCRNQVLKYTTALFITFLCLGMRLLQNFGLVLNEIIYLELKKSPQA